MWKDVWNAFNMVIVILSFIISVIHFFQGNLSTGIWALSAASWQFLYTMEKNIK